MSNKTLRTGMQKTLYQKIAKSIHLEISLVYNESDAHKAIYYSYDLKLASALIKNVELENTSNNSSL